MHTVRDILAQKPQRSVVSISENAAVVDAARLMNEHHVGSLVVTRGERVIGIFTERDILTRVVAPERAPAAVRVADVMTAPVACCALSTTRDECRSAMRHKRVRHLPVVEDDQLVGMISIGDLLADAEAEQAETIRWLHDYLYGP
ncbi:MAG: CBS domain-containing protein [Phycisphaerae bacterium]|nr:CBS domain-containing protein [Phycisphaerae bacterium]